MIQKEKLEAVVLASPLFTHADIAVACMEAGLHVLSEKMMAWDVASCERIAEAARKNRRVYEVGHQRFYNGVYQAAHEGIVKAGLLGELYHARLVWHRNGNWRRHIELPSPDYDASRWGYPSYDHLINWRLYKKYSRGHMAELASHQVAVAEWFFDATATAAVGSGGVFRFKDGREIPDHTYVTLEYPGGRTVVFTSIESNALRQLLRGLLRHEGHAGPERRDRRLLLRGARRRATRPARRRPRRSRSRRRARARSARRRRAARGTPRAAPRAGARPRAAATAISRTGTRSRASARRCARGRRSSAAPCGRSARRGRASRDSKRWTRKRGS